MRNLDEVVFVGSRRTLIALFCFGGILVLAGCGGSSDNLATASVSGKVSRMGQPVSGGSVTFNPQRAADSKGPSGKPAAGPVQADGSFELSTYGSGDGAIIGKHQVIYTAPAIEIDDAQHKEDSPPPKNPLEGLVPKTAEVEVKSGSNEINIELVPKSGS